MLISLIVGVGMLCGMKLGIGLMADSKVGLGVFVIVVSRFYISARPSALYTCDEKRTRRQQRYLLPISTTQPQSTAEHLPPPPILP